MATLFRKLQTVNDLVRPLSNTHRFRASFDSQHVKGSKKSGKIFMRALSSDFFITLREPDLQNICLSDTLNLRYFW